MIDPQIVCDGAIVVNGASMSFPHSNEDSVHHFLKLDISTSLAFSVFVPNNSNSFTLFHTISNICQPSNQSSQILYYSFELCLQACQRIPSLYCKVPSFKCVSTLTTPNTMAPGLVEPQYEPSTTITSLKISKPANFHDYVPGRRKVKQHGDAYEHEDLRPHFPNITWPAYTEIAYTEKGQLGDANFKHLLASATEVFDYNPKIGTEIHGVDLANLSDLQKNDLARLIATRGVVFFRDQKNLSIDKQRELGQYFGELHKHATTGVPKREGLEDVHVIYTGEHSPDLRALFTPTFLWHSDVRRHQPTHTHLVAKV